MMENFSVVLPQNKQDSKSILIQGVEQPKGDNNDEI